MPGAEREPWFAQVVYGVLDIEKPGEGWVRLEGALAVGVGSLGQPEVRCLELTAWDDIGMLLKLSPEDAAAFGQRLVAAYNRRRGRAVY